MYVHSCRCISFCIAWFEVGFKIDLNLLFEFALEICLRKKGILLSFHLACWPVFLAQAHSFFLPRPSLSHSFPLGTKAGWSACPLQPPHSLAHRTAAAQPDAASVPFPPSSR